MVTRTATDRPCYGDAFYDMEGQMAEKKFTFDDAGSDLTPEQIERGQQIFADVVARYYSDPDFRAKVDADPAATLKAEGFSFPGGARVKLLFNTESVMHIVLPHPTKPK